MVGTAFGCTDYALFLDKLYQQVLFVSESVGRVTQAVWYHQAVFMPVGETLEP
jgi:hypothetical protein